MKKQELDRKCKLNILCSIIAILINIIASYDVKRAIDHGLEKGCFDAVPRIRRAAVYNQFENAPDEIKYFINQTAGKLKVGSVAKYVDSKYYEDDRIIRMEKGLKNKKYALVFSHEYGHFYDDLKYKYSRTADFHKAINSDLCHYDQSLIENKERFNMMMNTLFDSNIKNNEMISDNMSAFFKNDSIIIKRYNDENVGFFQHDDKYWNDVTARNSEIFANIFSICVSDDKNACDFMREFFPETWNSFQRGLKEDF